ncbi:MAG: hypothetical protein IJV08_00595 [Bacteroidaceae bacterium]|nr:hypothetical protein [Bacteroidaceae bacterium]
MKKKTTRNSNHSLPSGSVWGRGRLWLVFLFVLVLSGCTLSMEDWVPKEEDMGKEEPTTIENEYGSITFQFNDSVLYVTENIQEKYLVRVEGDSVLYFNGSIPQEWRPYVGMKMAGGISHKIPYGLNNKVVSVEDQGGILKVVTTRVGIDEVYKELNYEIDAGLATPDVSGLSEEELRDYGYELVVDPVTGDSVVMDWNDYDVSHGLRPAGAKRRSLKQYMRRMTRAEGENDDDNKDDNGDKPKDGSVDGHKDDGLEERDEDWSKTWSENPYFKVAYDSRNRESWKVGEGLGADVFQAMWEAVQVGVDLMKEKEYKGKKFYIAANMELVEFKRVHAKRDKEAEIEESWTDSWSEFQFGAEAGFNYKKSTGQQLTSANQFVLAAADASKQLAELRKVSKIHAQKSWSNLKIRVIFTTTPIPMAIVAGANLTPIVEFNANVSVKGKYTSETIRSGYRVEKGVRENYDNTVIENPKAKPGISLTEAYLNGSFKLGASARIYGGIEFAGTVSVTIGVNVDNYVYGNMSFDAYNAVQDKPEEGSIFKNFSGSMGYKCEVYGDLKFEVAPLGLKVWDKSFPFAKKTLIDYPVRMGISMHETDGNSEMTGSGDQVKGYYAPTGLDGIQAWMGLKTYYPGMKCYIGPIKNNKWFYLEPADAWYKPRTDFHEYALKETGYYFVWNGDLKAKAKELGVKDELADLYLVPTMYTLSGYNPYFGGNIEWGKLEKYIGNDAIEMDNYTVKTDAGEPRVVTYNADQLWSIEGSAADRRYIGFYSTVEVKNGGRIKDWGVKVYVYDHQKKLIKTKSGANYYVIRPENANRSGRYTFICTFETNWSEYASYYDKDGNPIENVKKDMRLYFRVIPFWTNPNVQGAQKTEYLNATDYESKHHHPLVYEMKDDGQTEAILYDTKKYGSVTTYDAD